MAELAKEKELVQTGVRRRTQRARKDSRRIITELAAIVHILERSDTTKQQPQLGADIAERLRVIAPRQHDLAHQLNAIRRRIEQIQAFDLRVFHQLKNLPPEKRHQAKAMLRTQLRKIRATQHLTRFEQAVSRYQTDFDRLLQAAMIAVNAGDQRAIRALRRCIDLEKQALRSLRKMRAFEDVLVDLTKRQIP